MAKLIIILGLILSGGGLAFAQPPPPPWMEVPEVEVVPEVGVVPEEEMPFDEKLRMVFPGAEVIEVGPANTLIIKAPPAIQEKIREMVELREKRLDVIDDFQITIEARFVELIVTDVDELGIDLDILNIRTGPTLDQGDIDIRTDWVGFPAEIVGTSFLLTRLDPAAFTLVLRAMEEQGKANILSAPRVTTLNAHPTTISIEREIPYVAGVEVENVGTAEFPIWLTSYDMGVEWESIELEVTPTVARGSDLINLCLSPTVTTLVRRIPVFPGVAAEHGWPIMDERTASTNLVVRSGETIVLGGLIRSRMEEMERKVPLLGDIPLLGRVFRHTHSHEVKRNLLIFITAHLVSPRGERVVARR